MAVVIDTLNRSIRGTKSDDKDMTAYIRAADAIRDAFACAVVVVHHSGHDQSRMRGHTALMGALDCQIAVSRDADNNIVVTVERMKDGEEGETFALALERVEVGTDEDGEAITSCVVIDAEAAARPASNKKLSDRQQNCLTILRDLCLNGVPLINPGDLPRGILAVPENLWREALRTGGPSTRKAKYTGRLQARQRRPARQKLIAQRGEQIWAV